MFLVVFPLVFLGCNPSFSCCLHGPNFLVLYSEKALPYTLTVCRHLTLKLTVRFDFGPPSGSNRVANLLSDANYCPKIVCS